MSEQHTDSANSQTVNLGQTLREAREAQEMTIASAAMQTNLRADIIEKLENNQFSEIGAPVFTRGYLNIYARFLKLDDEIVKAGYQAEVKTHEHNLKLSAANIASQTKVIHKSSMGNWFALILVLLIGGVLISQLLSRDSWLLTQLDAIFADSKSTAPVDSQTEEPAEKDIVVQVASEDNHRSVEKNKEGTPLVLTAVDGQEKTNGEAGDSIASLSLTSLDDAQTDTSTEKNATTGEPEAAKPQDIDAKPVLPTTSGIKLLVTNDNWIEIKNKQGKTLYSRIFKPNESIELPNDGMPYRLNIGRPGSIKMTIDGKETSLMQYRSKRSQRIFTVGK